MRCGGFNLSRFNDTINKKSRGGLLLSLLLVAFTTLFSVGCGSSNGFVATSGGTGPTPTTGELVFNFTKAPAQSIEVPNNTTDLDFEFFDVNNNSVFFYTQAYANTVPVAGVPVTATRVVITARGANGPVAIIEAPVTVVGGGSVVVDLSGATITFLGQLVVEPMTLQFAPGGLIGAIDDLIALFTNGDFDNIAFFRAYFTAPGATERVEVTSRVGVSFNNFFPSTVTADSFAYLNVLGEGIAVTANPIGPTPPFGATATMTVTFIENGQVYTDDVSILLDNPVFTGIDAQNLTLPENGVTDFQVVAFATYSNGLRIPIEFDAANNGTLPIPGYTDTFVLSVQTPATGLALDTNGNLDTTGGGAGSTGVFSITPTGGTPTNFNVNLISGVVSEVALSVARTDLNPSSSYTVTVTYNDPAGTTQDVTRTWFALDIIAGTGDASFIGLLDVVPSGRLLGTQEGTAVFNLADGTPANVTTALNGSLGLPGADTLSTNNTANLNILSTVPLSIIGLLLFP
jgi:hypothetical protein